MRHRDDDTRNAFGVHFLDARPFRARRPMLGGKRISLEKGALFRRRCRERIFDRSAPARFQRSIFASVLFGLSTNEHPRDGRGRETASRVAAAVPPPLVIFSLPNLTGRREFFGGSACASETL
jgi:hypothetical protein